MKNAPIAPQKAHTLSKHGHDRQDPWFWLRERENPDVIAYIEAENAFLKSEMKHTETLQETLFEEMKGRIKQDDQSVPYMLRGYYYYSRFEEGKEYPIYCRKKESMETEEEIMLDVNELAEGQKYCKVAGSTVSHHHKYLAFGIDFVGRRIYNIRFKNLENGSFFPETIEHVTGNMVWANDNKTLFYSRQDRETLRANQIYRHVLGTDPKDDVLIYEETDDTFNAYVGKSKSQEYLSIISNSTLISEVRILAANQPEGEFKIFQPREAKHEYSIAHFEDHFYILTNWQAKNFRLMRCPVNQTEKSNWSEVIPHRTDVFLEDVEIFRDFLVLGEREKGLTHIRVIPWESEAEYYLDFHDPTYSAYIGLNLDFETHWLRYGYQSLTTPHSTYEIDLNTREKKLLKQQEVLGGFSVSDYVSERLFATAEDGTQIPMSMVYHKDGAIDGSRPLLLYGYGSYGYSLDPYFSAARLSLLDRGFIYVIAHIRGGQEMGRYWYEEGKLLKKRNTFTDFIACGEHLVQAGYTQNDRLFCAGGSAGGLLVGAVINMRPDLFHGAIASVPFVDVVSTMLDEDIPLTTGEYDEWGNPNKKEYYDYMLSYSPYDNVSEQDYPHLLITSGLHDSQVQYWEPTKWIAKLRTMATGNQRLLMHTNMEAGHSGASGRFQVYREVALDYAFLLDLVGE